MTHKIITVGIPKEARDFRIINGTYVKILVIDGVKKEYLNTNEKVSILGKLSELTDEQCKPLVEKNELVTPDVFWDYTRNDTHIGLKSAKESFISKLKAEGKICKWMLPKRTLVTEGELPQTLIDAVNDYNSLPDDFLILINL